MFAYVFRGKLEEQGLSWVWQLIPGRCTVCGGKLEKPVKVGNVGFAQHPECFFGYWKEQGRVPVIEVLRVFKGSPLKTANMECLMSKYSLNLTDGCPHCCVYCYARAMPSSPPHGAFFTRKSILARVRGFVEHSRVVKPVYMSPVSDPLATKKLAETTVSLAEFFVSQGIPFYLVTKGEVPIRLLKVVEGFPFFALQVSLNTLDRDVSRFLEPNAPPPEVRVRNLVRAKDYGVFTILREDPHMPFLTDHPKQIEELTQTALDIDVNHIIGSFMGLRVASPSHKEYLYLWFKVNGRGELVEKYERLFARGKTISGYRVADESYRFQRLKMIRDLILKAKGKTTYGLCMEGLPSLWIGDKCEGFHFPPVKRRDGRFVPIEGCTGKCRVCRTPCTPRQVKLFTG